MLLLRDRDPRRYGRAAARWLSRYARELPGVELDELLALAAALSASSPTVTAQALEAILSARHGQPLADVVRGWRAEHG